MDHSILALGDALPGATCEIPGVGPVNAQWARDLLCESFLTFVVKKGKDITTVAHFGRHIPAELRTALVVSGRECGTGVGTTSVCKRTPYGWRGVALRVGPSPRDHRTDRQLCATALTDLAPCHCPSCRDGPPCRSQLCNRRGIGRRSP